MESAVCQGHPVHNDTVAAVNNVLSDEITLCKLAEFFRIFGDSTRIRILYALSCSELCVCELSELLNASQSAVSHQLQILRAHRLVKYRREGKSLIYSLEDEHIFSIIAQGAEHIKE